MEPILFAEDDQLIAAGLIYALEQEGFSVDHCPDVAGALARIAAGPLSLGILDLSLPDGTGYTICQALQDKNIPVIFLTAADDEGNTVKGLELGAEDYITKPFRLRELMARIKGVLRRRQILDEPCPVLYIKPDIEIHTTKARVYKNGAQLEFTALEYRLLLVFASHRGQVLSRGQLLEGLWDCAGSFVNDNTLTVYIKRLREKLGDDSQNPQIIKTVRGMGYTING